MDKAAWSRVYAVWEWARLREQALALEDPEDSTKVGIEISNAFFIGLACWEINPDLARPVYADLVRRHWSTDGTTPMDPDDVRTLLLEQVETLRALAAKFEADPNA